VEVVAMMSVISKHERAPQGPSADAVRASAVAWIDGRSALVARIDRDGLVSTCAVERGGEPEPTYLDLVVRAIGDRERVVILGPGAQRLALERAYVAIHHRPERLVDVEPAGAVTEEDLLRRLRELAESGSR
jgi:hypothetical protein